MFDYIFVQNESSKKLLQTIGINAGIAFDTRFDRVHQISTGTASFTQVEKFKGNSNILIAGSTWPKDEEFLTALINDQCLNGYKYIIAPHDIDTNRIAAFRNRLKTSSVCISELNDTNYNADVLIVDTIGQLSLLYRYGTMAYVGGAFNTSVHNVLEPAVYGLPVIFGPNHKKSVEAKELLDKEAGFTFHTYGQFKDIVLQLSDSETLLHNAGATAATYIAERLGGTDVIFNQLLKLLKLLE
jgi:3-deoxy-D-manno-octulosonic-acid transferase